MESWPTEAHQVWHEPSNATAAQQASSVLPSSGPDGLQVLGPQPLQNCHPSSMLRSGTIPSCLICSWYMARVWLRRWDKCWIRLLDGMLQLSVAGTRDYELRIPTRIRAIVINNAAGTDDGQITVRDSVCPTSTGPFPVRVMLIPQNLAGASSST